MNKIIRLITLTVSFISAFLFNQLLIADAYAEVPTEVKIVLSEFKIESSVTTFSEGVTYRFIVTNKGAMPHEFIIMSSIAKDMHQGMTMEDIHKKLFVEIKEDELKQGAKKSIDFNFSKFNKKGKLELACHLPGHYESGMFLPITIK